MKKLILILALKITLLIGGGYNQLFAHSLSFNKVSGTSQGSNQIESNSLNTSSINISNNHCSFSNPKHHSYFSDFSVCESEEDSESESFKKNIENAKYAITILPKKFSALSTHSANPFKDINAELSSRSYILLRVIRI